MKKKKKIVLYLVVIALISKSSVLAMEADANDSQIILIRDGGAIREALKAIADNDKLKVKVLSELDNLESKSPIDQMKYEKRIFYLGFQLHKYREGLFDLTQLGITQKDLDKVRRKHVLELVAQETAHPGSIPEFEGLPPHTLTHALKQHTELPPETIEFIQSKVNALFVDNLARGVEIAAGTHTFAFLQTAAQKFHQLPTAIQDLIKQEAGIATEADTSNDRPKKEGTWFTPRKALTFGSGIAATAGLMAIKSWLNL
jgi:hypothetical protein